MYKEFKPVKRTLKGGIVKTYHYRYAKYTKRGGTSPLLIGKGGKVYQDRIDAYLNKLKAEGATPTQINIAKAEIKAYAAKKAKLMEEKKAGIELTDNQNEFYESRLTIRGLQARTVKNKYASMFINMGYTLEEAAGEIGVPVDELLNEDNWNSYEDKYTGKNVVTFSFGGHTWSWTKDYHKSVWNQIA